MVDCSRGRLVWGGGGRKGAGQKITRCCLDLKKAEVAGLGGGGGLWGLGCWQTGVSTSGFFSLLGEILRVVQKGGWGLDEFLQVSETKQTINAKGVRRSRCCEHIRPPRRRKYDKAMRWIGRVGEGHKGEGDGQREAEKGCWSTG